MKLPYFTQCSQQVRACFGTKNHSLTGLIKWTSSIPCKVAFFVSPKYLGSRAFFINMVIAVIKNSF